MSLFQLKVTFQCTYYAPLQFHCPQVEALGELSKLVTKTFSDGDVFNIYSSYVNNLAELQKNFKEEAESNQDFANFLKVFIPYRICQVLTFNCAGDKQQFWIKFGLVFAQHEARAETSPA